MQGFGLVVLRKGEISDGGVASQRWAAFGLSGGFGSAEQVRCDGVRDSSGWFHPLVFQYLIANRSLKVGGS
jgi:hypothetical protein